jgi:hypothetical protein
LSDGDPLAPRAQATKPQGNCRVATSSHSERRPTKPQPDRQATKSIAQPNVCGRQSLVGLRPAFAVLVRTLRALANPEKARTVVGWRTDRAASAGHQTAGQL